MGTQRGAPTPDFDVDACVIGAGVNGLVAAAVLADAGWDVLVVEANDEVGGAVRSVRRRTGTVTDLFSAFYPLAAASPVLAKLDLADHGLVWQHAPTVLAHPRNPGSSDAAVLHRDAASTAAALDADHPGDGARWLEQVALWQRLRRPLLDALFAPFPPVAPGLRLLRAVGLSDAARTARFLLLPAQRMGQELFGGEHGRLLLTGNALHADVPVTSPGSGVFAWLLCMLAQDVGYPVPRGGAGILSAALRSRLEGSGGQVVTGTPVESVLVGGGRAVGVRLGDGRLVRARRGVLAAVDAVSLLRDLVPRDAVPARVLTDLDSFDFDPPTVKLNWTLPRTPQWKAAEARVAGVVHCGADSDGAVRLDADLHTGTVPRRPFLLVGQMTTADPTRSTEGAESLWAYSHLPVGMTVARHGARAVVDAVQATIDGMKRVLAEHAPGFDDGALDHFVQGPSDAYEAEPGLLDSPIRLGAVNGGTAQLHQQLIFRPIPGLGRPELPIEGLYLAGSSAHPGGGVHGAAGSIAARACLANNGPLGAPRRAALRVANRTLYG